MFLGLNRGFIAPLFVLASFLLTSCSGLSGDINLPTTPGGTGGTGKVAVLIPESGPLATIGMQMRNASLMAYQQADNPGDLELVFYDTQGTDEGAYAAAERAVLDQADLIVGPLRRDAIAGVRERVGSLPVVAFSNDLTKAEPSTFIMGVSPHDVVRRILGYAGRAGDLRIAIIAPDDEYGRLVSSLAVQEAEAAGVVIVISNFYDPGSDASGRQAAAEALAADPEAFDAVLIPDGALRLREVGALLAFYRVDPQTDQFYGTRLWEDATLADEPSLRGGIFANVPTAGLREFETAYFQRFGQVPVIQAAIAYDVAALAALLRSENRRLSTASLTAATENRGVMGTYRFNPEGTVERLLEIKQISEDGVITIEAAPEAF